MDVELVLMFRIERWCKNEVSHILFVRYFQLLISWLSFYMRIYSMSSGPCSSILHYFSSLQTLIMLPCMALAVLRIYIYSGPKLKIMTPFPFYQAIPTIVHISLKYPEWYIFTLIGRFNYPGTSDHVAILPVLCKSAVLFLFPAHANLTGTIKG